MFLNHSIIIQFGYLIILYTGYFIMSSGKSKPNLFGNAEDAINFPLHVVDKQVVDVELTNVFMGSDGVMYNGCEVYLMAGHHTNVSKCSMLWSC